MPWIEPISTVVTAAMVANEIAKSSPVLKKHASRIQYLIKNREAVIPVFGAGGVGKTTLSKVLGGANPFDIYSPYQESWDVEQIKLNGNIPGRIFAAPGQINRVLRHWPGLIRRIVLGRSFGLINVVTFGYHSFDVPSYKNLDVYKKGDSKNTTINKYLEERRKVELQLLSRLMDGIVARTSPLWMVTLVNKQDLWWDRREIVRQYYELGPYTTAINEFATALGAANFQHEFLPVSMALGNLVTASGEVMAQNIAGYDLPIHYTYLQSMFSNVEELLTAGVPK